MYKRMKYMVYIILGIFILFLTVSLTTMSEKKAQHEKNKLQQEDLARKNAEIERFYQNQNTSDNAIAQQKPQEKKKIVNTEITFTEGEQQQSSQVIASNSDAQGDEELNAVEKDYIVRSANFPSINTKTDNNVLKTVDNLGNTAIASLNGNILRIIVFDNQNTVKWQNQTTLTTPYVHKLNNLTFFDEQNIEIVVNNTENNSNAGSEKLVYNLDTSQSGDVYSVYNLADHVVEQQPVYSMNNKRIPGLTATQRFKIGNNNYYIIAQDDTQYVSKYSSVIPRKFYIYREISGILDPIKYLFRSSAPKNKLVYELTKVDIDEGYLFIENLVNANLSKYYSLKNVPNMPVLSNSVSLKLAPKIKSQDTEYDIKVSELQSAVSE